jgi:hypothetical protein
LGFPQKQGFFVVPRFRGHGLDIFCQLGVLELEAIRKYRPSCPEIAFFFSGCMAWLIAHIIHRSYCHGFGIEMLTENEFVVYQRVFLTTAGATGEFV